MLLSCPIRVDGKDRPHIRRDVRPACRPPQRAAISRQPSLPMVAQHASLTAASRAR